jgi:hypothetical protein
VNPLHFFRYTRGNRIAAVLAVRRDRLLSPFMAKEAPLMYHPDLAFFNGMRAGSCQSCPVLLVSHQIIGRQPLRRGITRDL